MTLKSPYVGYILEAATEPIVEHLAKKAMEKAKWMCGECQISCEDTCSVIQHEYHALMLREWQLYAMGN